MKKLLRSTVGGSAAIGRGGIAALALLLATGAAQAQSNIHGNISSGVGGSGSFGRNAIKEFNVRDNNELDTSLPELGVGDAARAAKEKLGAAVDLLAPSGDGRIQLFNVSRLSKAELENPFEIRVQVRVDVREIEVEVGGIVEGGDTRPTTALLLVKQPVTVTKEQIKARENAQKKAGSQGGQQTAGQAAQGKKYLCSVGDQVEGFRIQQIRRDRVVLEMMGNYMEIARGIPVTVCVPLSSIN